MIAPEPGAVSNKQTRPWSLLAKTLLASILIFASLEFWRPYFFLTDDSLDGTLPFFLEIGRHLLHGQSPFISDGIFGGNYYILRDPASFGWNPIYMLVALLEGTPFRYAVVDIDAFILLMLATSGFVLLAHYLRRESPLTISDGWIMFYALSYTYSMIVLSTGASWFYFLGNHSAFPWLALGILQKTWRNGIILVAVFALHQLLGGHLSPTFSGSVLFSMFALAISLARKSILPFGCWCIGYTVAILVALPLLIPMFHGFFGSIRAQGVSLEDMRYYNISISEFPTALFTGAAAWMFHEIGTPHATYTIALAACATAWCLMPALANLNKWRPLEAVTLGMLLFNTLLIVRPVWMAQIMLHLPLFKSMRWPFRELLPFQFFLHLFLLVRPPGLSKRVRTFAAWGGTIVFVVPLLLYPLPPTFNSMVWDRELVLSGGFDRYWDQVRPLLKPGDRIAVILPQDLFKDAPYDIPFSLLGTYDYGMITGVPNVWGYSPTVPMDQVYTKVFSHYSFGAYLPEQKAALLADRPETKFITLESLHPLKITLDQGHGVVIDLSPFIPPRIKKP